jgi:hypothetical protein
MNEVEGQSDKTVVNWFYSRREGDMTMSHTIMLRSILHQIYDQCRDLLSSTIHAMYRKREPFTGEEKQYWAIEDYEAMLGAVVESSRPIICILDGLDESEDGELSGERRQPMIAKLAGIITQATRSRLKFIALSRPLPEVAELYHTDTSSSYSSPAIEKGYYRILMEAVNSSDISILVEHKMQGLYSALGLDTSLQKIETQSSIVGMIHQRKAPELETIRRYLLANARGVVLWVILMCDELGVHCRKRGTTLLDLKKKAFELPLDLVNLYKLIVHDLKQKSASSESTSTPEKVRKIIMLVSATGSTRPIELQQLWDILAIPDDIEAVQSLKGDYRLEHGIDIHQDWTKFSFILKGWCGPFLDIVYSDVQPLRTDVASSLNHLGTTYITASATVQLLHQSVKDFFADADSSDFLHFTEEQAMVTLQATTTQYMQLQLATLLNDRPTSVCTGVEAQAEKVVQFAHDKYMLRYATSTNVLLPHPFLMDYLILPEWEWNAVKRELVTRIHGGRLTVCWRNSGSALQLTQPGKQSTSHYHLSHWLVQAQELDDAIASIPSFIASRAEGADIQGSLLYLRTLLEKVCTFGSTTGADVILHALELWSARQDHDKAQSYFKEALRKSMKPGEWYGICRIQFDCRRKLRYRAVYERAATIMGVIREQKKSQEAARRRNSSPENRSSSSYMEDQSTSYLRNSLSRLTRERHAKTRRRRKSSGRWESREQEEFERTLRQEYSLLTRDTLEEQIGEQTICVLMVCQYFDITHLDVWDSSSIPSDALGDNNNSILWEALYRMRNWIATADEPADVPAAVPMREFEAQRFYPSPSRGIKNELFNYDGNIPTKFSSDYIFPFERFRE